ncbi:WD40-repeat-containing domain protein [Syncephalis fuscata]|nr:WD40-repeat-containing domain protein [Syncephalis fuscata]
MRGLRSKHSGSSDGSSSPRSPSISHSNTANNGRSTDKSISYIKIRARHKRDVYLRRLVKMQELQTDPVESKLDVSNTPNSTSGRGVWALQISRCGRYLAASGQDHIVRVWCLATAETNKTDRHRPRHVLSDFSARKEIFCSRPMRTWIGHQNDVLELAWSKNNFLLSSSMDKTVKLWHVTRDECLYTFKHPDFVTSVVFHPKDERLFLSGCMDSKLRLWSIPEKRAKYWQEIPNGEVCTAVGFTADGRMCAAGSYSGNCIFYRVSSGLKYHTQILVKSRGKSGRGKKITGIQAMPGLAAGEDKMLITSNDSRIRLYNLRDMSLERRFKGLRNVNSQIRATFSDDGRFVICGSEDRNIYVWDAMDGSLTSRSVSSTSTNNSSNSSPGNGDWRWLRRQPNPPYEQFHAHDNVVTTAVIAPMRTKQLLSDASSKQALAAACIIVSGDYAGQIRVFVNTPPDITTIDGDHDAPHVSKSTTSGNPRRRTMMTTADSTSILSEATWTADTESMMSGHDTIRHERSDSRAETLVRPRIITGGASSIYSVARSDISGKGSSIALTSLTRNQSFFSSFVSLSINDNNSQHIHTADHTLADSASVYSAMTPPSVTITHVPFLDVDPTSPETTSNS